MKRTWAVLAPALMWLPFLIGSAGAVVSTPTAPTGVAVKDLVANGQLKISWVLNTETDILFYGVDCGTVPNFEPVPGPAFSTSVSSSTTFFIHSGLINGTTYYYHVHAINNMSMVSPASVERKGIPTAPPPPAPPQVLGITNPGTGAPLTLILSWLANTESNISIYRVMRGTITNFETNAPPGFLVGSTGHPPPATFTDPGPLVSGTRYFYHVHARDTTLQESSPSAELSEVAMDLPPSAPRGFSVLDFDPATGTSLKLLWQPNTESDVGGGSSQYTIYRTTTTSGIFTIPPSLTTIFPPGTTHQDAGLTLNRPYRYALRVWDFAGNPSLPTGDVFAVPGVPSAPSNLGVTDAGTSGRLNLSWKGGPELDIAQYRIWRGAASGPLSNKNVVNIVLAPGTTFQDRNLVNGTPQFYQVTARDSSLNESAAATAEASGTPTLADAGLEKFSVSVDIPGVGTTQVDVPKNDIRVVTETRPDIPLGIVSSEANQTIVTAVANTQGGEFTFRVFTLAGELVYEKTETKRPLDSFSFVPQDLGSGIYIITVEGPGMKVSKKVAIGR